MRASILRLAVVMSLFALGMPLHAQEEGALCYRPRPRPQCRVVFLTNAGGFVNVVGPVNGDSRFRAIVDWGLLMNQGPHDAIGTSFFLMLDEDEFSLGPTLRYRRWFSPRRSLDVSVGTALSDGKLRFGSVLGTIKYNPNDWFGVALRPEYVRRRTFDCTVQCIPRTVTSGRVYAGIEAGWYPGLGLSLGGGVAVVLLAVLISGLD
jgi:hypothetical protein